MVLVVWQCQILGVRPWKAFIERNCDLDKVPNISAELFHGPLLSLVKRYSTCCWPRAIKTQQGRSKRVSTLVNYVFVNVVTQLRSTQQHIKRVSQQPLLAKVFHRNKKRHPDLLHLNKLMCHEIGAQHQEVQANLKFDSRLFLVISSMLESDP